MANAITSRMVSRNTDESPKGKKRKHVSKEQRIEKEKQEPPAIVKSSKKPKQNSARKLKSRSNDSCCMDDARDVAIPRKVSRDIEKTLSVGKKRKLKYVDDVAKTIEERKKKRKRKKH